MLSLQSSFLIIKEKKLNLSLKENTNVIILIIIAINLNLSYVDFIGDYNPSLITYSLLLFVFFINLDIKLFLDSKILFLLLISLFLTAYQLIVKIFVYDSNLTDVLYLLKIAILVLIFSKVAISKANKFFVMYASSTITIITSYIVILYYYNMNIIVAIDNIGEYFYDEKNGLSPLLLVGLIFLTSKLKIKWSFLNILTFLLVSLGILSLVIIQSRTNIMCYLVFLVLFLAFNLFKFRKIKVYLYSVLSIMFAGLLLLIFNEKVIEFFNTVFRLEYLTYVNGNGIIDKFFSGRLSSIQNNFNYFYSNPFFGTGFSQEIIISDAISPLGIHNLWLRSLIYGGLFYTAGLLVFLLIIFNYFKGFIYANKTMYWGLILVGFLSSLSEPYSPFGPGSNYFYFWLFFVLNLDVGKDITNENRNCNKHSIAV